MEEKNEYTQMPIDSPPICSSRILVVFDFDDTLFPTRRLSSLFKNKTQMILSKQETVQLINLSKVTYLVLKTYIEQYKAENIRIVTCSENGWIKSILTFVKCIGYFKCIYSLLFIQNKIEMIHPNKLILPFQTQQQAFEWKCNVFYNLYQQYYIPNSANIFISIGDSITEFEASKIASYGLHNVFVNRIKLIRNPTCIDMINEMKLLLTLCGKFEMVSTDGKVITMNYESENFQKI
eukprot:67809_1